MSGLGKLQAAELGLGVHPSEGHPKAGSAETQYLLPQLMAGRAAAMPALPPASRQGALPQDTIPPFLLVGGG